MSYPKRIEDQNFSELSRTIANTENAIKKQIFLGNKRLVQQYESKLKKAKHILKYHEEKKTEKDFKKTKRIEAKELRERFTYLMVNSFDNDLYKNFCSDLLYHLQTK